MAGWRKTLSIAAIALLPVTVPFSVLAQSAAPQAAVAPAAMAPAAVVFSREELTKLLAPVALYPDELLAQLLPASAYPLELVQAARWLGKNKAAVAKKDFSGADAQNWDPAVKAMVRF